MSYQPLLQEYESINIAEREKDIEKLAESVKDVSYLFQDLNFMVQAQTETIDNIAFNCDQAAHNVEKGVEQVVKASKIQKKSRFPLCCLALVAVVLVLVIAVVLIVVFV